MKPLKDLAELNLERVDHKILLQFNTLIENIRMLASNHAPSWGTHEILKCFEFMDKLELITPAPQEDRVKPNPEFLNDHEMCMGDRATELLRVNFDVRKYLGSDGSGNCDSFNDPDFNAKKWLGET